MGFLSKWFPVFVIFMLVVLAWYVTFGIGLVPAYSRDPMDVGIWLDFDHE